MGTWNRLLSLGPEEYFELIAIEPGAPGPAQPRWFDLDNFAGPTRATTWICRCDDLDAALALAPRTRCTVVAGARRSANGAWRCR
jgi:hypothetical protein